MAKEKTLQNEFTEALVKFEKAMQDLHLLRHVSKDLKNYKKMIKLKKYD